jgi:FKBP-type peptidyl-prolyl cis-trans isomerase
MRISTPLLTAFLSSTARAFQVAPRGRGAHVLARHMSSSGMPYDEDKMPFYALGTNLAIQISGSVNLSQLLDEEELDVALEAFCAHLKGTSTADSREVLTTYGPTLNKILSERTENIMDRIKEEGEDFIKNFLECNEEATKTDSGMVYYEMKEGDGAQPSLQSTVEVHYHGTLIDGTVFDSSVDRGQTISFPLGGVIKGWQEGLQLMKEGGKATLVIPSDLAYGDQGSGETIPPGATLKFEVELFKVS